MRQFLAVVFQLIFLVTQCPQTDSFYNNSEVQYKPFQWEPMIELHNSSVPSSKHNRNNSVHSNEFASDLLNQAVYVTLTTIHSRIYGIVKTIESIILGAVLPDHIYIFVSKDPHLLDLGVTPEFILSESKGKLEEIILIYPWISVIFTENIGPHRKLLPLLAKKWNEDCVIVTIDDHELYGRSFLQSLLEYYEASDRSAVVALRARRMGICSDAPPWRIAPYTKHKKGLWPEASPGHREMLLLPTGTGGVLYRPKFFHPVVFDRRLITLTKTGDDLMFRLATIMMGVPVVTACAEKDALGKICQFRTSKQSKLEIFSKADFFQRSIMISRNSRLKPKEKEGSSAVSDFTFGHNYTDDSLKGNLLSPGVHTLKKEINNSQVIDNKKEKKKSRNKPKDKNKDKRREMALAVLNNPSGVRIRYLEEENFNLRKDPNIKEWKQDFRKKESLAAIFNNVGGNNEMWDISLKYLFDTRKINFEDMLQFFVPFERKHCLIHSNIVQRKYGEGFSYMLRNGIDTLKVSLQKLYSPECGVCVCSYNKNIDLNISTESLNGHIYGDSRNYSNLNTSNLDDKNDESSFKKDSNISDRDENIDSLSKDKVNSMIKDIENKSSSPSDLVDIETGDVILMTPDIRYAPMKKMTNFKRVSKQINSIGFNAHNYFGFISLTLVLIFVVTVKNRFLIKVISSYTLKY